MHSEHRLIQIERIPMRWGDMDAMGHEPLPDNIIALCAVRH
jgi:hypothetical protein